ncbi:MAG: hypothetical protein ACJARX_001039 [Psychroserpens sp.]|jgi:hypothetical protein
MSSCSVTTVVGVNMSLNLVFYLSCIGEIFLLIMVCKVLKDKYSTTKIFDDFYEDYPIGDYENYR